MDKKTAHDSEVPAHGQQVITACAFMYSNSDGVDKVFFPKRAETKKFLPGGHIDFGEDIVSGLKREIKEEFDMEISVGDSFATFTYTDEIKGSHSIEVVYFAKFLTSLENIKLDPADHSECGWFTENDLAAVYSDQKGEDDIEIQIVQRGFGLLSGNQMNFG